MAEVLLRVHNNVLMDAITIHVHGIDKHEAKSAVMLFRVVVYGWCSIYSTMPYSKHKLDWTTESTEEAYMRLMEKTMKWMYGFDGHQKCWQPTRTLDGGNIGGAVPISALLINDRGWYNQTDILTRPWNLPLERFLIRKGETVLFRITNGGVAQELMLHIEGHKLLVVAADGNDCAPQEVDRLIIFPGERYDVALRGLKKPIKRTYMLVIETVQYYYFDWTRVDTDYGVAFLEYEDVDMIEEKTPPTFTHSPECTSENRCIVLNCPFENYPSNYNFTCLSYEVLRHPKPEAIDAELLQDTPFEDSFEEHFINMHYDSHVNGFKFEFPKGMPYYNKNRMNLISKECDNTECPSGANRYDKKCKCFFHLKHKLNNIVQITIFNMGKGGGFATGYAHPYHIHGTHYHIMKVGWPKYNASGMIAEMNPDIDCDGADTNCDDVVWRNKSWLHGAVAGMNTRNPSLRDTVTVPVGGYVVLRFRATNPGWWFAHCHLELHHMSGTAYAFQVGEDDEIPPPPANFPHDCGYFSMPSVSSST
ncbi:unnamed protein product [Strongylus vulgaris]|uniref:Plastocyanin-like domain-containing protein n=1 Tax=Strongylus vulgaris TaxID=40348 RepID=A0A3P7KYK6_STRVU|nr:unnamed protein product [Strongylus vulgaris]